MKSIQRQSRATAKHRGNSPRQSRAIAKHKMFERLIWHELDIISLRYSTLLLMNDGDDNYSIMDKVSTPT